MDPSITLHRHEPPRRELRTEELLVNMGPQHPSTHGVLRVLLHVDGEVVADAIPYIGYLHRGTEKIAEHRTYVQVLPLMDRFDYLSAMTNNQVYVQAVETLMGIEVPERAHAIRVLVMELQRIASHLVWLGTFAMDVGAMTVFLYAFRDRERILSLFEAICGARLTYSYMRIGGVPWDIPDGWFDEIHALLPDLRRHLDENDELLTGNEIFIVRTKGVGRLSAERTAAYGCTGPILRAAGVPFDVRKTEPYAHYERYDFDIPTTSTGDVLGRYLVRIEEMRQSIRIIEQAMAIMPGGAFMAKVPRTIKPPKGEVYTRVESPRGLIGAYLTSDGTTNPYRFHLRGPSFINLQAFREMARGWKIGDVVAILGSIDIVLGEVDR